MEEQHLPPNSVWKLKACGMQPPRGPVSGFMIERLTPDFYTGTLIVTFFCPDGKVSSLSAVEWLRNFEMMPSGSMPPPSSFSSPSPSEDRVAPIVGNILQEADRMTSRDRNKDYGHPYDDFGKTAALWSVVLGIPVSREQVALCMVQVKISRQLNKNLRDNLVDACGYLRTLEMVKEREKQLEEQPREI